MTQTTVRAESAAREGERPPFLAPEHAALARYLPGLVEFLDETPLLEIEQSAGEAISQFRAAEGPALLFPEKRCGLGASALDAVRIQRAVGSRAPSLAIATTMHHFAVAGLVEYEATEIQWLMIEGFARERLLLGSGGAEGKTGQDIFEPQVTAHKTADGYVIRGSKKPCSLTESMDICAANVAVVSDDGAPPEFAVALIPRETPGLERRPFWGSWILAGAESDELVFNDILLPEALVAKTSESDPDGRYQVAALIWFETLITASYLGIGSALVERAIATGKGEPVTRARLAGELEAAMSAIEGVALTMMDGDRSLDLLARCLFVRGAVQQSLVRTAATAMELLGGMAFIRSSEVAYLAAAVHALAFHPPSRGPGGEALSAYLAGEPLELK